MRTISRRKRSPSTEAAHPSSATSEQTAHSVADVPLTDRVTPLLLTWNEAENVQRALDRLSWAHRIVLVDSHSTDETIEIARTFSNVDVYQRTFDTHSNQWNYGLDQVATEWVLSLDADYVTSQALIEEIRRLPRTPEVSGYSIRFRYCVQGRPLRGSLYPARLALFRRSRARYVQDGHTQRLVLDGEAGSLRSPMYHDDRKSLPRWLEAQRRYAELEAEKLSRTSPSTLSRVDRLRLKKWPMPLLMPLYCLVAKGLILDGRSGWYYAFQRTYAELLLAVHLFHLEVAGVDGSNLRHAVHN